MTLVVSNTNDSTTATPIPRETAAPRRRAFWPALIIVLLSGHIFAMLIMVYLATTDGSFAVEPDYYQKSLDWDHTLLQTRQNERLGWSARVELGPTADVFRNREVFCVITNRAGIPVDDADVQLVAFSHARGNDRCISELDAIGNGRYRTTLRVRRPGLWEFRITARRGDATFTQTLKTHVDPPGDSTR